MENKVILNRLENLRKEMLKHNIDCYLIPTEDYHQSEYVGSYFKCREYISGFSGSAGTVIVTKDEAILWADSRYFLQAEDQLEGTSIKLFKMGEPGVLTIFEYIKTIAPAINSIGFDGKCVSSSFVKLLKKEVCDFDITIIAEFDLVGNIWKDRPCLSNKEIYELDIKYSGKSRVDKFEEIKQKMSNDNVNVYFISSLDDIAWLYNIRGNDVLCNPVCLSYTLIKDGVFNLYLNKNVLNEYTKKSLEVDGVIIKDYFMVFEDLKKISPTDKVYLNESASSYLVYDIIFKQTKHIKSGINYTTVLKAVKNDVEIKNSYLCHIKDGVALTKFIYWVKTNAGKIDMSELSCAEYLYNLRSVNENFKGLSFDTIAGYKEHGAIVHYEPTTESNIKVFDESFLLVDSGAQYLEGTTDVTRTIALGDLSEEQKLHYTLVLKGHLALGDAVFKKHTTGLELDMLAHGPLWKYGLTYNHGTGHGVGSFLNVHEGPQNISSSPRSTYPYVEGMITSNEPGLYITGEYGIRIENLILSVKDKTTEFGEFLKFDTLTLAPYEVDAIDLSLLNEHEIKLIHEYHERVYNTLCPYLNEDELAWLKKVVEAI